MKTIKLCLFALLFTSYAFCKDPYPARFEGIFQDFETHPLAIVEMFVPKDPVIFEAGGHYGADTLNFSKKWPASKIITFEPNPHAFEKLLAVSKQLLTFFLTL